MKIYSSMILKINHNAPLDLEIKRILTDLIDESLEYLENSDQNIDECVHEIRKNTKKARATLRLIRSELPTELYQRFNALFRDISREFSEARDSRALLDAFNGFVAKNNYSQPLQHANTLLKNNYIEKTSLLKKDEPFKTTKNQLETARYLAEAIDVKIESKETLIKGLVRNYKKASKAYKKAIKATNSHEFHEWRKEQKHLLSHFLLLEDFFSPEVKYYPEYLEHLSELLGKEHDLAVLSDFLKKSDLPESDLDTLSKIIQSERKIIQEKCREIGTTVFQKNWKDLKTELML